MSSAMPPLKDRFERVNFSYGNDGDKNQYASSRNISAADHGETGSINLIESLHPGLIPLDGCASSEAAQIMNERWAAAIHFYNDPSIDLSDRPVVYSGASGSAWVHAKLPPQVDFLAELRHALRNTNANSMTNLSEHN